MNVTETHLTVCDAAVFISVSEVLVSVLSVMKDNYSMHSI